MIEQLARLAAASNRIHGILLMVEMGDLREGLLPESVERAAELVIGAKGAWLAGIGANFACLGGIEPDREKIAQLSTLARDIERKFDIALEYVSGGNSANYDWFVSTNEVDRINNLRLGESIFLGRETLHRRPIPELFTDAFKLYAEVIEVKKKPSKPYGRVCQDAFGNVPEFKDRGVITRAILAIGLQDVPVKGLTPYGEIEVLGASSDHVVIDARETDLCVGDEVEFDVDYGALLAAMTSPYVTRKAVKRRA